MPECHTCWSVLWSLPIRFWLAHGSLPGKPLCIWAPPLHRAPLFLFAFPAWLSWKVWVAVKNLDGKPLQHFSHVRNPATFLYPCEIMSLQIHKNFWFLLFISLTAFICEQALDRGHHSLRTQQWSARTSSTMFSSGCILTFPLAFISLQVIVTLITYLVMNQTGKMFFLDESSKGRIKIAHSCSHAVRQPYGAWCSNSYISTHMPAKRLTLWCRIFKDT